MDLRKIIKEEVSKALFEGKGMAFGTGGLFQTAPTTFDHLKWELNDKQKFFLKEMCRVHPDSITEADIKDASLRLGIPEKNVKSIVNTYNEYKPMREMHSDSEASKASALTFGNKPASSKDIGLTPEISRVPDLTPDSTTKVMHTNPKMMSKQEMKSKYEADMLNRTWYREGEGKEHPSKAIERLYENLTQSLMMYLYCESNPKDINLRQDDKIQIEFDPVIEESNFNKLAGAPSYESEKFKFIKGLLEVFNKKFNCNYVIYNQINHNDCERIFIEHNVTKQVDMSQDSIAMMKKFLLPKVMTGHKIQTNDPSVATLMGLDAGDTDWLYGKIGEPMQSGVLSKIHKGRA